MKSSFIVTIPIRDCDGRTVGTRQVIRYEGLLAQAHEDGLRSVHTELVQVPSKANGDVAIVRAVVVTCRGTFEGIGDASPSNTRMTGAVIRVAETRAKARALRDAVNIGLVSIDELDDVDDDTDAIEPPSKPITATPTTPAPANGNTSEPRSDLMSHAQRRLLFRIAAERGVAIDDIGKWLENHWGLKDMRTWSKTEASRLIEKLKANGHAGAAP